VFLTPNELILLTGYHRQADQRKWLTARGWRFETAMTGRPVVARSYAESRIGAVQSSKPSWSPNLAAIVKRA
jgi:hypothetical protein